MKWLYEVVCEELVTQDSAWSLTKVRSKGGRSERKVYHGSEVSAGSCVDRIQVRVSVLICYGVE